jgi:hypothetical protein
MCCGISFLGQSSVALLVGLWARGKAHLLKTRIEAEQEMIEIAWRITSKKRSVRRSREIQALFGIVIAVCVGSMQAMAADTTWSCSAAGDPEALLFKFEVKDGVVSTESLFKYFGVRDTIYKIAEETDVGLVAVHVYSNNRIGSVSALVLLINKVSSVFRQTLIRIDAAEPAFNYEGACQAGK